MPSQISFESLYIFTKHLARREMSNGLTSKESSLYRVNNVLGLCILSAVDFCLRRKWLSQNIPSPKKVLICNIAHRGDVILSSFVLYLLKQAFPQAKIGFLLGSWSRSILEESSFVDYLHCLDHWKLNRSSVSFHNKWKRYCHSYRQALHEISTVNYDLAIDLYSYFPNAIPLLSRADIPYRLGYTSGGFGPLLTHPIDWKKKRHIVEDHLELLKVLGIDRDRDHLMELLKKPSMDTCQPPRFDYRDASLQEKFLEWKEYCVFHVGSDNQRKKIPLELWQPILRRCVRERTVVFSGKGPKEKKYIQKLVQSFPEALDLCDRLSWKQFQSLIEGSRFIISIDSAAAHAASIVQLPSLILFFDQESIETWAPLNQKAQVMLVPSCRSEFPAFIHKVFQAIEKLEEHSFCKKGNKRV
jgi:ADP-heptose:LPS heptosyltransferase